MKIAIVGTGKVAWHFAQLAHSGSNELVAFVGRNATAGAEYSAHYGVPFFKHFSELSVPVDMVVIAVKDDAIQTIAESIPLDVSVIHTSGATGIHVLPQAARGVLWAMHSFKKEEPVDFAKVNCFVEASDDRMRSKIQGFMGNSGAAIYDINSEQRSHIHVAAVFANNFINQMWQISEEILNAQNLPFDVLRPMIEKHAKAVMTQSPEALQTGPASRADLVTLHSQMELLKNYPEALEIYKLVSNRILNKYHGRKEL